MSGTSLAAVPIRDCQTSGRAAEAVVPPPPLPPHVDIPPVVNPPLGAAHAEQPKADDNEEKDDWLKFTVGNIRVVINPYNLSMGCHCLNRGHGTCRINKVATRLPAGYFLAWADWEPKPGEADNQANHFAARLDSADGGTVSYEKRKSCRDRCKADPRYARLFNREVPQGQPEPLVMQQ
jgi:hypothetical protein